VAVHAAGRLLSTKYNDFANLRWPGNQPPAGLPIFATEESGKWVCPEATVRLDAPGQSGGTFYLWIDDKLEARRENLNWRGN
jgi:hypothetical protein